MDRRNDEPTRNGNMSQTTSYSRRRILQIAGLGIVGGAATIGTASAESESYSNELVIVAADRAIYSVTTDGRMKRRLDGENSAERYGDSVTKTNDGTWTADGVVGNGGGDAYLFEGSITAFQVNEGSCTVYLNGNEVSPGDLGAGTSTDSTTSPAGGPVGGGAGYADVVSRAEADIVVATKSALLDALSAAGSGDVVYLAGDASIDVGTADVEVPAGVTLASNRGIDGAKGGHLFTDEETKSIFLESGSRLTGVRVQGPFFEYFDPSWYATGSGVRVVGSDVEIDNNEIWGFAYASVVTGGSSPHVHHNNIHHNPRDGLGYGVVAGGGRPLIEWNYFDYNRHSVASGGSGGYVVRNNHFGPKTIGHVIDMHKPGGDRMEIYNNTIEAVTSVEDGSRKPAVAIRGVPDDGATIRDNWFYNEVRPRDSPDGWTSEAISQIHVDHWTNVDFSGNHYGSSEPATDVGCPR